ncbi:hypothetical protein ACO2Q0_00155 [Phenylobacterium sp. VNQ135]|uniref:hypothetical protein n=1 Tax=Phenylobacterium sp. VNQ135 TaxID=3400922 RepID=UPI003BFB7787
MTSQNKKNPDPARAERGVRPDHEDASPPQTDRSAEGPDKDRQIAQERQQSTGLAGQS